MPSLRSRLAAAERSATPPAPFQPFRTFYRFADGTEEPDAETRAAVEERLAETGAAPPVRWIAITIAPAHTLRLAERRAGANAPTAHA